MFNRVLVFFRNGMKSEKIIKHAKALSKKYGVKVDAMYVRDSRRYEIMPGAYGVGTENVSQILIDQWEKFDEEFIKKSKALFEKEFEDGKFIEKDGVSVELLNREMMGYDLLLIGKDNLIDDDLKSLLRTHVKPMILINNSDITDGLEKILFANDGEINSNASLFSFLNLFGKTDKINSISVNCELEDRVGSYMKEIGVEYSENLVSGKRGEEIEKFSKESDLLIMGNLRHSFIVERLGKKLGLRLLENVEIPIYIG